MAGLILAMAALLTLLQVQFILTLQQIDGGRDKAIWLGIMAVCACFILALLVAGIALLRAPGFQRTRKQQRKTP
jgi:hypothetical protein